MSAIFEKMLSDDLHIFFDDLSEKKIIDRSEKDVVLDYDRLKDRSKKEYDGISVGDILYFIKRSDLDILPSPGDIQNFDGKICQVFDVRVDKGIAEIILTFNGPNYE